MSLPYFPLYPADFEADTSHLSLEEDGAYNRLLRLCWMTPGCCLPDDPAWIARRMRVDAATYDRVVAPILAEFFRRRAGRALNPRLSGIFAETDEKHKRRVEAGRKGGRPRKSLDDKGSMRSNAKAMPKQPEPEPEPEEENYAADAHAREPAHDPDPPPRPRSQQVGASPTSDRPAPPEHGQGGSRSPDVSAPPEKNAPPSRPIGGDPPDPMRVRLLALMGVGPDGVYHPSRRPLGMPLDTAELERWRGLGLTDEEIAGTVAAVMARPSRRPGPPGTFAYFTEAMRELAALKSTPLTPAAPPPAPLPEGAAHDRPAPPPASPREQANLERFQRVVAAGLRFHAQGG